MYLTRTIDVFEAVWVAVAVFGLWYCLMIRFDAQKDLVARLAAGINSGREELARLLVTTTTLSAFAFIIWLVCGLLLWTEPPVLPVAPYGYLIKVGIIASEVAIAAVQFLKQRTRHRVLVRDMGSKQVRDAAAAKLAREEQQQNTEALVANTTAVEAATRAVQNNGTMRAQIAQTEATAELTEATEANTDVIKISTEVELKKMDSEASEPGGGKL